jgi:hypothetical protein
MNVVDERLRAEILKAPDPAIAAAAATAIAQERRIMNSRLNRVEIGRLNDLIASFDQNNRNLVAFGDPPTEFEKTDPLDLRLPELLEQTAVADRLVRQQMVRLADLRAHAAAAERQLMISKETPIDRQFRLLTELLHETISRVAVLEGRVAASERDQQFVPPVRPKPPMSGVPVSIGDGLCAGVVGPPIGGSARHR